jgi:hypothetical protein
VLGQRVRRYAEATRYFGYDPVGAVRGGMGALGSGAVAWQRLDASSDPRHIDEARSECCQSVKVCRGVAHDCLASSRSPGPGGVGRPLQGVHDVRRVRRRLQRGVAGRRHQPLREQAADQQQNLGKRGADRRRREGAGGTSMSA